MKKMLLRLSLLIIILNIFIACALKKPKYESNFVSNNSKTEYKQNVEIENKSKIIYNAIIDLKVTGIDSIITKLSQIAKSKNGIIIETSLNKIIFRVPSKELENTTNLVSSLGKVTYKNTVGKDVSDKYFDYEIRLENYEIARKKYLDLLGKSKNVSDMVNIEKELERLNLQIDSIKSKLNKLDYLVKYSTITVNVREKEKLGLLGYIAAGLYSSVKWLFVRN